MIATSDISKRARVLAHILVQMEARNLTSLHKFHKFHSGNNIQNISVGNVILVHDKGSWIHWKLVVIEKFSKGGNDRHPN